MCRSEHTHSDEDATRHGVKYRGHLGLSGLNVAGACFNWDWDRVNRDLAVLDGGVDNARMIRHCSRWAKQEVSIQATGIV